MPDKVRINKYVAECTGCSRREADELVKAGQVSLNNKVIEDLSTKVSSKDKVKVKNKVIELPKYQYIIFNKPPGYITTRKDEKGRKTIYDVLPEKFADLKPVGRLDKDTSGLLLLTNNGDLINSITHPKFDIPKRYKVVIKGKFNLGHAEKFAKGIDIGDNQIAYGYVLEVNTENNNLISLKMELTQGYNRQIRRMIETIGSEVVSLKRLSVGPLNLKNLKKGEYSILQPKEVKQLMDYINKNSSTTEK